MLCIRFLIWFLLASGLVGGQTGTADGDPTQDLPPPTAPLIHGPPEDVATLGEGFGLPAGFTAALFATEPQLANPVALAVDHRGRCFVAETFSFGKRLAETPGIDLGAAQAADLAALTPADRLATVKNLLGDRVMEWHRFSEQVRLLEDTDSDGRANRSTVFASGFNDLLDGHASGVLARGDAVWFTCIPTLWRLQDLNGDGLADERTPLQTGFGVREGIRGHDLHGLVLGPDARLYFSIGDRGFHVAGPHGVHAAPETGGVFRCEPDGSALEVVATGLRNPQGLAFDDAGNLFTVDNNGDFGDRSRLVQVVPGGDSGWRMTFFDLPDRGPFGRERLWHLPHEGQPAWIVPPLAHFSDGPAGLDAYPGTGLPAHFEGRFLLADFCWSPAKSSIRSFKLEAAGASFEVREEEQTFRHVLATDVKFGPDGAVWVANWVEPQATGARGRIWRFLPEDDGSPAAAERIRLVAEVQTLLVGDWTERPVEELITLLEHDDRRVRCEAQWELARRGATERLAATTTAAVNATARRHAAWGLEQIGRRDPTTRRTAAEAILPLLCDTAWENRVVACRCLGDLAVPATVPMIAACLEDAHPHVVAAAGLALGRIADPTAGEAIIACLRRAAVAGGVDPHLRHSLVMGIVGTLDAAGRHRLATDDNPEVRLAACLAMRRSQDRQIATCLDDTDPRVAVEAARAIHDVPIAAATDALIACLAEAPADGELGDALLRRAISAAERQGTTEAARYLARCAAQSAVPVERRLEALAVLAAWAAPPPRDRVLAAWRPAATRDASDARAALDAALPEILSIAAESGPESIAAVMSAAAAVGCREAGPLLDAAVADAGGDPISRATALRGLAAVNVAAALARAADLATAAESALRLASRQVRAAHAPSPELCAELAAVAAAGDLPLAERQQAIDLLATHADPAAHEAVAALAVAIERGELGNELELETLEAVDRRLGPAAASLLRTSREPAAAAAGVPPGWHDVAWGGDADRGRRVFFAAAAVGCVRCHRAEGRGGNAGPNLDGLADRRERGHLIESIVSPNAQLSEGFATAILTTNSGRRLQGVVMADDGTHLTIRTPDGTLHGVAVAEIEERTPGDSTMPADLAQKLSRRDLRDLVEWLASLRETAAPEAGLVPVGGN
jgi:quinoprotein glucose dehydrogenase